MKKPKLISGTLSRNNGKPMLMQERTFLSFGEEDDEFYCIWSDGTSARLNKNDYTFTPDRDIEEELDKIYLECHYQYKLINENRVAITDLIRNNIKDIKDLKNKIAERKAGIINES